MAKMSPKQKLQLKAEKQKLKMEQRAAKTADKITRNSARVKDLERVIKAENTRVTGKSLKYQHKQAKLDQAVKLAQEAGKTARVSSIANAAKDAAVGTSMSKWNSIISNNANMNGSNQNKDTSSNTNNTQGGGQYVI